MCRGFKLVYLVYLLAECRWYSLAWLRAKGNWVCVELSEGDGKREGPGAACYHAEG